MFAYCVFCDTRRCGLIASTLSGTYSIKAFSPQILKTQRKQGVNTEKYYDLFPGYIFLFSENKIEDFNKLLRTDGVIRILGNSEEGFCLKDGDLVFALELLKKEGVVGRIKVLRVGDRVVLDDPLFFGCEGKITKIDYRKQRARVDFCFSELRCHTWIACDCAAERDANQ